MEKRPDFIKSCEELRVNESFSYPGDTESFGTGAALSRKLGLMRVAVNYEVLQPGDCVGLPPGTGYAHCLINNSDSKVRSIVVGEVDVPEDKIFYPKHPARNEECKEKGVFWDVHPTHELGPHDGWSDLKRPK